MIVVVIIINALYAALHLLAAIANKKKLVLPTILMILGSLVNIVFIIFISKNLIYLNIIGMILISISAFLNGYLNKETNLSHHITRTIIEVVIILLALFI